MKARLFLALPLAVLLLAATLPADEKSTVALPGKDNDSDTKETKKVDYSKIAEAGPGVYKVELDKQGRVVSCLVVGTSRISTTLGVTKGKEVARQRAELRAKGEFTKWLKEKVSVHQKSEDETIIFLEGNEENDKDALRESGKAVEKTTAQFETRAQGLVRGMQVVHVEINGKDKEYSLVMKWKARTANAVKQVERDLKTPAEDGKKKDGKDGDKKTEGKKKPDSKKIPDKKITIDDDD